MKGIVGFAVPIGSSAFTDVALQYCNEMCICVGCFGAPLCQGTYGCDARVCGAPTADIVRCVSNVACNGLCVGIGAVAAFTFKRGEQYFGCFGREAV